jgi:nitrogen regulatory protein PII
MPAKMPALFFEKTLKRTDSNLSLFFFYLLSCRSAGATGATIINARGSGIHEKEKFFAMDIEPEKEIVMIILNKEKTDKVVKSINGTMDIEKPGKGIIFVMDVSRTSGLVS